MTRSSTTGDAGVSDVETLKGLLKRVRAPDGMPGIDLNLEASLLHGLFGPEPGKWPPAFERLTFNPTVSVDAAIAMASEVLPGWDLEFDIHSIGKLAKGWATFRGPNFSDSNMSEYAQTDGGPKPAPLAILDALLQALIARSQEASHAE